MCGRQPSSCRSVRPQASPDAHDIGGVEGRGSRAEIGRWLCGVNRQEATEGITGSVRLLLLCLCVFVCALVDQQHGHNTSGGVKLACINTYSDSFVFISAPLLHIDGKRRRPIAFPAWLHKGQEVFKKKKSNDAERQLSLSSLNISYLFNAFCTGYKLDGQVRSLIYHLLI